MLKNAAPLRNMTTSLTAAAQKREARETIREETVNGRDRAR